MRWPWVSRAEYDDLKQKYHEVVRQDNASWWLLHDQLKAANAKNEQLVERLLSLKITGAVEPLPPLVVTPEQIARLTLRDQPDELRDLIDQRSAGNLRIRGMMLKQLAQDRADGIQDEDIRQRILDGVQSEGLPS